jgi:photosystem II stability/assembly factor-like uncharacterized protein
LAYPLPRTAACLVSLLLVVGPLGRTWAEESVPYAEPAPLAPHSLLLDLATAGDRLVAVGERGHILWSDDQGRTWRQAESVPTQALLTGVCFADARRGVAVGHDEVILTTQDGGYTWQRTHYAPQAQQPLLDVWCGADGRVIAVGAYSAYFTSGDGGASWTERKLEAQPAPDKSKAAASGAVPAGDEAGGGYHLNRIVVASAARLYVAAEAGHLYRSDDGGSAWTELPSPYEGSFFGVLPLGGDVLLAYGLRGNLFRSEDAGSTWQRIETGTVAMLDGATKLENGGVVVVGLSGVVLVSHDGGRSFTLLQQADRKGLSAALPVSAEELVAAGEGGVKLIQLNPEAEVSDVAPRGRARDRNRETR